MIANLQDRTVRIAALTMRPASIEELGDTLLAAARALEAAYQRLTTIGTLRENGHLPDEQFYAIVGPAEKDCDEALAWKNECYSRWMRSIHGEAVLVLAEDNF